MSGYVYLIRNGVDLYKIGITQNLEQRMKQLKPDKVVSTLRTEDFETLEKELHKKYKDVRIPQSEYFRLTNDQLIDCKKILNSKKDNLKGFFPTLQSKLNLIGLIFLLSELFFSATNWLFFSDINSESFLSVLVAGIGLTSLVTVVLSIGEFFSSSEQYLSTVDAIKDRFQRSLALFIIAAVLVALLVLIVFIAESRSYPY